MLVIQKWQANYLWILRGRFKVYNCVYFLVISMVHFSAVTSKSFYPNATEEISPGREILV